MDDTGLTVSAPPSATMGLDVLTAGMWPVPQIRSGSDPKSALRAVWVRRNVARLD